jgi:hypothetical protein
VVEAKENNYTISHGLQQALGYAEILDVPCAFSSNGGQLWAGTLRKTATRPLLVQVGLVLGCAICLVGLVPAGPGAMWLLTLIVLVLGLTLSCMHPVTVVLSFLGASWFSTMALAMAVFLSSVSRSCSPEEVISQAVMLLASKVMETPISE